MCSVPLRQASHHHVGITDGLHLWRQGERGGRKGWMVSKEKEGREEKEGGERRKERWMEEKRELGRR